MALPLKLCYIGSVETDAIPLKPPQKVIDKFEIYYPEVSIAVHHPDVVWCYWPKIRFNERRLMYHIIPRIYQFAPVKRERFN